jgi:hypothetical protein
MIIRFPNLDTLRLTISSGTVPPEVAQKPAVAGFGDNEQVWVETNGKLSTAAQRELKRLGAVVCKSSGAALDMDVSTWLELLPLVREEAPLVALEKTPVLFDVAGGEELSRLVLEMLRLGNDRQSYRWLEETGKQNEENGRALLRVVGPPYYSLLRAIDQLGGAKVAPHAFVERAPGVWVEAGYRHPLAANIKPAKGKILLLRPPRQWLVLSDAPFRDIYEIVEFHIPDAPLRWKDRSLPHRLTVVPRLRQAGPAEGAELWVLRGEAVEELNRFVQNAEDSLLNRLAFAVGDKGGQSVVVLRVRQSKLPPPILLLPAEAYKSYLKLPNLFLPAGCILHPPLRRDVVRKLLAEDVHHLTWLVPAASGGGEPPGSFTPETLPDDVFRPLTDWVDYVLDRDREKLQAWVQAMQFDFEPFVCDEEQSSKAKKPPTGDKTRSPKTTAARPATEAENETTAFETLPETTDDGGLEAFPAIETRQPSEIEKELHAVEEEFLSLPNGLEDETRRALWPRLADLNTRLARTEDAAVCWLHALWEENEASKWTGAWLRTEALAAGQRRANGTSERSLLQGREVTGADLDRLLAEPEPASAEVRALAAYLCWSARREPHPPALTSRLPSLQRFLEKHEHLLSVRACWLAWYHLVQLTDGDVLALARARDRLLERLFHNGLRAEQDLPTFLRFAGQPSERRGSGFGQWTMKMHELARRWVDRQRGQNALDYKESKTKEYVDLIFAFALARLGEHDASRQLLQKTQRTLGKGEEVHTILFGLFEYRIRQALEGQSTHTPMKDEALERLNELRQIEESRRANTTPGSGGPPSSPVCYIVDKMRSTSRILEPLQKLHEYRYIAAGRDDDIEQTLAQLPDVKERAELKERINRLLKNGRSNLGVYVRVLKVALEQSPRVGEEVALQMLKQALQAYDRALQLPVSEKEGPSPESLIDLLERGLFVAAHFGQLPVVQELMARFRRLLHHERGASSVAGFDRAAEQCLRGLRKLGLRQEIQELLALMSDALLKKRDPAKLLADKDSGVLVRTLLPIAAAWYDCGREAQAEPIYQAARTLLLAKELVPMEHLALACAYAKAVGATPIAILQARLEELFERLDGISMTSSYGNYFVPSQLKFVESVVLAMLGDDFTQGTEARRWLDEDEYLVRQRIHEDVRNGMAQT